MAVTVRLRASDGTEHDVALPDPTVTPPPPVSPIFPQAHWLWDSIPANPVLHASNAAWASALAAQSHVAALHEFGVTVVPPSAITAATPRYDVTFSRMPAWGPDPFGPHTMPIPDGTAVPPGSDGHLCVLDPVTGLSFGLWQASKSGATWRASWGGRAPLDGDGLDTDGASVSAGWSRYAGTVLLGELQSAVANNTGLNHALFFSSNISGSGFVYPANHSDGSGSTNPPQGTRVQLNPSVNVDAIPGITAAERAIAKTLQTHGAYLGDSGGARMGFIFEYQVGGLVKYSALGLGWDYYDMSKIPWSQLRVLRQWNGA